MAHLFGESRRKTCTNTTMQGYMYGKLTTKALLLGQEASRWSRALLLGAVVGGFTRSSAAAVVQVPGG